MANVSHATLTGSQLHEPKGVSTATLGEVYVADGTGSGNWANVGTSSFTGMIADFTWPVVQTGWLELDGSDINTTTYSALYDVMTIQTTGTRVSGNAIITSLGPTTNMRAGYFVFGTGIASGTTILSVDNISQITLSANASSTGTSPVVVSPWLLNTGVIRLPNVSAAGRFRRSRTSTSAVGSLQADQNQAHTHGLSVTGTTDTSATHQHDVFLKDPGHFHSSNTGGGSSAGGSGTGSAYLFTSVNTDTKTTGITIGSVTGVANDNKVAAGGAHSHAVTSTGTSGSTGGTEARPLAIVVMTCVKT